MPEMGLAVRKCEDAQSRQKWLFAQDRFNRSRRKRLKPGGRTKISLLAAFRFLSFYTARVFRAGLTGPRRLSVYPQQRTSSAPVGRSVSYQWRRRAIVFHHLTGPAPWARQLVHHEPASGFGAVPAPLSSSGLRNDRSCLRKHLVSR